MNSKSYLDAQSVVSVVNFDGADSVNQFLSCKSITVGKIGAKSGSAKWAVVPDDLVGENRAILLKHIVVAPGSADMDTHFDVTVTDSSGKVEYLSINGTGSELSAQGTYTANMDVGALGTGVTLEVKFKRANAGENQPAPVVKVVADGYVVVPV